MEGKVGVYSQVWTGANSKFFSRQKVKLGLDHLWLVGTHCMAQGTQLGALWCPRLT